VVVASEGGRRADVFISYARASSAQPVGALAVALKNAGIPAYVDTLDGSVGESISEQVLDALLQCRVAIIFVDEAYFTSRYCTEEFTTIVAAYRELSRRNADQGQLDEAAQSIVVALPAGGLRQQDLELLPPEVRVKSWPRADETGLLVDLVRRRVGHLRTTIGQRLAYLGELTRLRESVHQTIPVPMRLGTVPTYHEEEWPESLGDGFIGRAREIWELHRRLAARRDGAAAPTIVLEGGGGFGKTRLALEYIHRLGPLEFTAGLFWVNADVPEDRVESQLHGILRVLRPTVPDLAAFRDSRRQVSDALALALQEAASGGRVLYVIDNVPEPRAGQRPEPLLKWCPAPVRVSLLLTSRAMRTLVGGAQGLDVHELAQADAMRLLVRDYVDGAGIPDDSRRRIVTWVGEWPLALELLNAALRARAVGPNQLLKAAEAGEPARELERHMDALRPAVPPGTLRGVAEALSMSYDRLTEDARRAARLLARLAPTPIPDELVATLDGATRVQLRARSFVLDVPSGTVPMFGRMHRVIADFLRGEATDREEEIAGACEELLRVMSWDACADPGRWPLLDACRAHAEAVLERESDRIVREDSIQRLIHLNRVIARLQRKQGRVAAAEQRLWTCVEWSRRRLGAGHDATLAVMQNLAWVLGARGDHRRARELQEHVLQVRQRRLAEDHPDLLAAKRNLALSLRYGGELTEASELQDQVWRTTSEAREPDDPERLTAIADLAATLRQQGEPARARELELQLSPGWWLRVDVRHLGMLNALRNLASSMKARSELDDARVLLEHLVVARRKLHGDDHPDTLSAMADLASVLADAGDLDSARELHEHVLHERQRVLGDDHPDTLAALRDLYDLPPRDATDSAGM
jgi:hypothetical protein